MSRKNAPERSRGTRRHTCALFSGLALLFFLFSVRFGTILTSFWSPWDLKNLAFSLRGSSNSSFSLFSLRTLPGRMEIIEQMSKLHTQAPQKLSQSSPGALRSLPGEPQELPKTTPGALGGHPWASKGSPGVVLEASKPHFGALRASFCQFFLLFQSLSQMT